MLDECENVTKLVLRVDDFVVVAEGVVLAECIVALSLRHGSFICVLECELYFIVASVSNS